jgi:hypothetical protein
LCRIKGGEKVNIFNFYVKSRLAKIKKKIGLTAILPQWLTERLNSC